MKRRRPGPEPPEDVVDALDGPKTVTLQVRVSPEASEALRLTALAEGVRVGGLHRAVLYSYLRAYRARHPVTRGRKGR